MDSHNTDTFSKDTYSLLSFLDGEVDLDARKKVPLSALIVPRIQRPYAQGRSDELSKFVRRTFLDELFEKVSKREECDLNFIYGIVSAKGDGYVMELLDGQQRITTLFLLYWYLACAELRDRKEDSERVRKILGKFKYETRTTSTLFCQRLVNYNFRIEDGLTPSQCLRKVKWYFKSFDRDSTVCAMLNTLDDIHTKYSELGNPQMFDSLECIRFYVKSLGVFNLSEELYVKMNARGLQLSAFENFKADLVNFLTTYDFDGFRQNVSLYKGGTEEEVSFGFNFSVKLDSKWVDIFWRKGNEESDDSMMSFFTRFFSCRYVVDTADEVTDREMRSDETIENLYTNSEQNYGREKYSGFTKFHEVLTAHPENILLIDRVLDVLYDQDFNSDEIFRRMIPAWDKGEDRRGDDFYRNVSAKNTHVKMIAFGAFISFVDYFPDFDLSVFDKWMRVVWNIIENTNIDGLQPTASLMRKFEAIAKWVGNDMAENCGDFYTSLSTFRKSDTSEKENRAVVEEVEKARRIAENQEWEDIFRIAERHPYFKGMVTFFYSPYMGLDDFKRAYHNASTMFDESGISEEFRKEHILIRAIVSQLATWDELNNQYITERAETQKYLKNLLASNQSVRKMVTQTALASGSGDMLQTLQNSIDNAPAPQPWPGASENQGWGFTYAVNTLRRNMALYDWVAEMEAVNKKTFRLYWFNDHITLAQPRKVYARVALDTERAKTGKMIAGEYGFKYYDGNQETLSRKTGQVFGSELWLSKEEGNLTIWVGFLGNHKLVLRISAPTPEEASGLLDKFEDAELMEDDSYTLQFPEMEHWDDAHNREVLLPQLERLHSCLSVDMHFLPSRLQILCKNRLQYKKFQ